MLTHLLNTAHNAVTTSKAPLAVLFTLSLVANGFHGGFRENANATEAPEQLAQAQLVSSAAEQALPEDGIYVYGQSPEPNQLGQAYMVFEVRQKTVQGGFYMPHSSFDCFHGVLQADQMALTVIDSYSKETSPYAIALEQQSVVATNDGIPVLQMGLEGFHPIAGLSEIDQQVLGTCRVDAEV